MIDSHAHLQSQQLIREAPEIVQRAREAGLTHIITLGTSLATSRQALALADQFPEVYACVGIHPTDVTEEDSADWISELRELSTHPKVVAIGETGLDHYHPAPEGWTEEAYHARQETFFIQQIELAIELGLNVVVHERNCQEAILRVMEPYHGQVRAVFHCFQGDGDMARFLIDKNHLVSFTGLVTFKRNHALRDMIRTLSPGTFMVETDCPYLAPEPFRGKRCEPSMVIQTAQCLAAARNESLEIFREHTNQAAAGFFRNLSLFCNKSPLSSVIV